LAIGLSALLAAGPSGAAEPAARASTDAPSTAEMREAEKRFAEGLDLYGAGNINEARVKLVQAYAVLKRTTLLWNLAVAEFYSQHPREALRHMRVFVRAPDAEASDVKLAKEKLIPEAEKQTARLRVEAAVGKSITVDGEALGVSPLADVVDVLPGHHRVTAAGESGDVVREVDVGIGQQAIVQFPQAPTTPREGQDAKPEGESKARGIVTISIAAGAVIALGLGATFLVMSSSSGNDATRVRESIGGDSSSCTNSTSAACVSLRDDAHAQTTDGQVAVGAFIAGGVLAAGAAATWIFWPHGHSGSASAAVSRVAPLLAPHVAGAAFTTRF
jgi:hypothetical protein